MAGIEFVEDKDGNRYTYDVNGTSNYSPAGQDECRINEIDLQLERLHIYNFSSRSRGKEWAQRYGACGQTAPKGTTEGWPPF